MRCRPVDCFVEPLPLSHIESGAAGDEARYLYRYWREHKGVVKQDKGLTRLSRKLMLFRPKLVEGDVPPSTMIGKDTTFRRFFPATVAAYELPAKYRTRVADGYHKAINGEPAFDIQRTGSLMGEGTPDLVLERLILRFETPGGFVRLFCLMTLLEEISQYGLSDLEHRLSRSRQGTGRCRSEQVHLPATAPHSHAAG